MEVYTVDVSGGEERWRDADTLNLHCLHGPALRRNDGSVEYWLHGVPVTPEAHAARTGTKQEPRQLFDAMGHPVQDLAQARLDMFAAAALTSLRGGMPTDAATKLAAEIARAMVAELDK